jgi:uncharacterized iron-regulated membrane protein
VKRPNTPVRLLARRVHFLAGIVVAPFLIVMCLTGLAYVFSPQIHDNLYHSQLYVNDRNGSPHPLSEQIQAALTAHPEGKLQSVITPPDPDHTTRVVLSVPGQKGTGDDAVARTVFVDPYTDYINGELTTVGNQLPANTWLRQLHSNLHLGEPGRLYAELAASWLLLIVLGGLVLWLAQPRGRKRITWRELLVPSYHGAKGWSRLRGIHGPLGLWLAGGLLVLSITGLLMSQHAGGRVSQADDPRHHRAPALAVAPVPVPRGSSPLPDPPVPETPVQRPERPVPPTALPSSPTIPSLTRESPSSPGNPPLTPEPPPPPESPSPTTEPSPPPGNPPLTPEPPPPPESPSPTTEPSPPTESASPPSDPSLLPIPLPVIPTALPPIQSVLPVAPAAALTIPAGVSTIPEGSANSKPIDIDQTLDVARSEGLSGELIISPPHGDGRVSTVAERSVGLPIQRDSIAINPYTAQVTERIGWGDYSFAAKLTTLSVEFHTGTLFGIANQILLAVLAIGLLVLIGIGYRMWWVHNPYRGRWASLPPPVWRQLSRPVLVLVVLAVAALSWVMPVFGVSLVGFVVIDGVITTIKRRRQSGPRARHS